jgi:hypothetical protein
MHNHLDRNLTGYGADTPDPQWPGEARIAVSFVLNYEEGGENTILNGDPASEVFLCETPGGTPIQGGRDLSIESQFEYGCACSANATCASPHGRSVARWS